MVVLVVFSVGICVYMAWEAFLVVLARGFLGLSVCISASWRFDDVKMQAKCKKNLFFVKKD